VLALFRIPIDLRRTAESNSNSLGVTHNSLHTTIVCGPHDANRQPAILLCRHAQAVGSVVQCYERVVRHRGLYSISLIEMTPSHYAAPRRRHMYLSLRASGSRDQEHCLLTPDHTRHLPRSSRSGFGHSRDRLGGRSLISTPPFTISLPGVDAQPGGYTRGNKRADAKS
jgi:hypothetical protein